MIEGLLLAVASTFSILLTFKKFPKRIKRWFLNHKLVSDILAMGLVYTLLSAVSSAFASIVGSVFTGLFVGLGLELHGAMESDPELKAHVNEIKKSYASRISHFFKRTILAIPTKNDR